METRAYHFSQDNVDGIVSSLCEPVLFKSYYEQLTPDDMKAKLVAAGDVTTVIVPACLVWPGHGSGCSCGAEWVIGNTTNDPKLIWCTPGKTPMSFVLFKRN